MVEELRRIVDSGCLVGTCFLDLSKTFDTMDHAKVVLKLMSHCVTGIELAL